MAADIDVLRRQVAELMAFKKQAQPILDKTLELLRGLPQQTERIYALESGLATLMANGAVNGDDHGRGQSGEGADATGGEGQQTSDG